MSNKYIFYVIIFYATKETHTRHEIIFFFFSTVPGIEKKIERGNYLFLFSLFIVRENYTVTLFR